MNDKPVDVFCNRCKNVFSENDLLITGGDEHNLDGYLCPICHAADYVGIDAEGKIILDWF